VRYAVVSDIHGNLPAFQTVLADARPFDAIWCLGDLVGYGPNPNECIELLLDYPHLCIAGNHDWGAIGRSEMMVFNQEARQALVWTQGILHPENRQFLTELPSTYRPQNGDFLLAHGSPREPIWEYLLDVDRAKASFLAYKFQIAFVGHTHLPFTYEWLEKSQEARLLLPNLDEPINLEGRRLILNPGSVGQPRDGDPRASYGILDTEAQTWQARRVPYPVEITQERMRVRQLPERLISRLEVGR